MTDIFILNETWVQVKYTFYRHFAWFKYFTYCLVVLTLTTNYKQHILFPAKVIKVCYSLAELHTKSVYLNLFWVEGGATFMKHCKLGCKL
jgi:hypothetical protein